MAKAKKTKPVAHKCHLARVRIGDVIVRADGSRSTVTDVQHYLTAFIGRTAEVWGDDGLRIKGAPIRAEITVIAGPQHIEH